VLAVDGVDRQPGVDQHIPVYARLRLDGGPQTSLEPESAAVQRRAGGDVPVGQFHLQAPQVMGDDRVVRGERDRALQSLGVDALLFPAEPTHAVGDVHLDLEVAH